jgi:hypothetical protein
MILVNSAQPACSPSLLVAVSFSVLSHIVHSVSCFALPPFLACHTLALQGHARPRVVSRTMYEADGLPKG